MPRVRSLRLRLIGAAALAIFVSVAVLGSAAIFFVNHQLRASLDRALRERAIAVARLAASAPALLTAPGILDAPSGGRQLVVEVVDRHGAVAARSAALGAEFLPGGHLLTAALAPGRGGYATGDLDGQKLRLYAAPLADVSGPVSGGAVVVGSSLSDIQDPINSLRHAIILSAIGAALLGGLAASALTARGLRPLRRLSDAAGTIEQTGDATARLPALATGDELDELSQTLNGMLAALERARETERRLLADASHELRNPLTSLRGNADYIARHGAQPEALADLQADAERLSRLLDDLLALEREQAEPPPLEPLALDQLISAAVDGAERVQLGRIEPVRVAGEPAALERALANLIVNAQLHGPAKGRVTVELQRRDGHALLSVSDEGPGLTSEEAAHAFDRFWRGADASRRPGSGLGLAIVRATAERHGGRATVEGSRFSIELPALQ